MIKKLWIFTLSFIGFTVGYAKEKPIPYDQGHAILENQFPSGYNQQAGIKVDGSNAFISGSFIYWQAMEGGLELGELYVDPAVILKQFSSYIEMNFKYKPGFKVIIGKSIGHDNWLASVEYTWLHFSEVTSVAVTEPSYYISTAWTRDISLDSHFIYSTAQWKLRYDMIDLELTRPCYTGTNMTLKPFISIRGGLIKQFYNISYDIQLNSGKFWITDLVEKTWLVGPRFGMDFDWIFINYFRLIGNAAMSLFYQHFKTVGYNLTYSEVFGNKVVWNVDNRTGQFTPNIEGAIGLGCGSYFGQNNRWHFDLSALYEVHYFFDQNKMQRAAYTNLVTSDDAASAPFIPARNLMMHGLTITARVDF
jgi:hypothetical protein